MRRSFGEIFLTLIPSSGVCENFAMFNFETFICKLDASVERSFFLFPIVSTANVALSANIHLIDYHEANGNVTLEQDDSY